MPTIIYLDVDDEVTSAAARIRAAPEGRLALVLPTGSRLATSRINFRLLAREAQGHERELSIVAPESGTRSLAASAGLPVFATVTEYEGAMARGAEPPAPVTGDDAPPLAGTVRSGGAVRRPAPGAPLDETRRWDAGTIVTPPIRQHADVDVARRVAAEPTGGGRRWLAIAAALVIVLALAGSAAAYVVLPTATVTVKAVPEPVGPLVLTVKADPLAQTVDPVAGVVPAEVVAFDLEASGEFPASGTKVTETKATGRVRWSNCDPTSSYRIQAGTTVRTRDGVAFATAEAVFLPVALLSGGNPPQLTCQNRNVDVTAAKPGEAGNVAAGAIMQIPTNLNEVVLRLSNPEPTSGGTHVESKIVTQEDVTAATTALTARIEAQFETLLADPARAPVGTEIVPETRTQSRPQLSVDPATLVDREVDTFTLDSSATGTATAVRLALVSQLGDSLIRREVAPDRSLVKDSVLVDVGPGEPDGPSVVYEVTASAQQIGSVDASAVRESIRGRSLGEARERLRDYGDATLDVWPGWVTDIPTLDFRLEVRVIADVPTEPAETPEPSVAPTAPARPTPAGT